MGPKPGERVQLVSLSTGQTQAAEVGSLHEKRLLLLIGCAPPRGLVKVEGGGWLVLGEIIAIELGAPASAVVGIEHLALNTDELARRTDAWRG